MRKLLLLHLLLGVHLAACHPYLYDECIVKHDGVKVQFTTFGDTVNFRFAGSLEYTDVKMEIKYGSESKSIQVGMLQSMVWMEAQLVLTNEPRLVTKGDNYSFGFAEPFVSGTRKYVTIENAYVLLGCPQGLPSRELEPKAAGETQIPLSGREDKLILIPTVDTKVIMEVDGTWACLCRNSSLLVLAWVEQPSPCGKLERDKPIHITVVHRDKEPTVKILGHDRKELFVINVAKTNPKNLQFLRNDLDGPLNIVQCLYNCDKKGTETSATTGASGTSAGGDDAEAHGGKESVAVPMEVFIGVTASFALLTIILLVIFIYVNIQLQLERRYRQEEELPSAGLESSVISTSLQERRTTTTTTTTNGTVDTLNDVYESYDTLMLKDTNALRFGP